MKNKKNQGMILIELLIAMAIFVVGTVAVLSLFTAGTQGVLTGLEKTRGFLLSNEAMEAASAISRYDQNYLRPGKYEVGVDSNSQWVLIPRTGLMGHFLLANNAQDSSSSKNQAAMSGIAFTGDRKGHPLSAARFNGENSHIKTVHAFPLQIEGPLTIAAWVLDTHPNKEETRIIAEKKGAYVLYQKNYDYFFEISGQGRTAKIQAESDYRGWWEHVAGVYDPAKGSLTIYINGQEKNSGPANNITSINKSPEMEFFIGASQDISNVWHGQISDVRVYKRSLTSGEIDGLYRNYSVPHQKSLVISDLENMAGVWSFNEGEGCIAHDNSKNNNHGMLLNSGDCQQWTENRHLEQKRALLFDGNNYIKIAGSDSLRLEEQKISIAVWVKTPQDLPEENMTIFHKKAASSSDTSFALNYYGEEKGYGWSAYVGSSDLEQIKLEKAAIPNRWQHIIVTFDGQNHQIYINNKRITGLSKETIDNPGTSTDLFIGRNAEDQKYLSGFIIDELRIYNKVLTETERQEIFLGKIKYSLE